MITDPKAGYTTTEFWVTLLTAVAGVVGLVHPGFSVAAWVQPLSVLAPMIASILYTRSRSLLKTNTVKSQAAVAVASDANPTTTTEVLPNAVPVAAQATGAAKA